MSDLLFWTVLAVAILSILLNGRLGWLLIKLALTWEPARKRDRHGRYVKSDSLLSDGWRN